jgi:DNA repair protein RadC
MRLRTGHCPAFGNDPFWGIGVRVGSKADRSLGHRGTPFSPSRAAPLQACGPAAGFRPLTAALRRAVSLLGNSARQSELNAMDANNIGLEIAATFFRSEAGFLEPATSQQIVEAALLIIGQQFQRETTLNSPRLVQDYMRLKIGRLEHEVFATLLLDTQHRLLAYEEVFRGTIDTCMVHAREVLKIALANNAAGVIFAHNHPSGIAEPSQNDRRITERLREALGLVDIRVIDHLVVGGDTVVSFAERGWL